MPGPIPNRSDNLARPRERKGGNRPAITKGELWPVEWPEANPEWHPLAIQLYESCQLSGQSEWYQQSDIAMLYILCDDLDQYKRQGRRSAQMAQTLYSALGSLLVTEGERRRARIELSQPETPDAPLHVAVMSDYRKELGVE